jgi:predicted MFS family arabinose efflux permease
MADRSGAHRVALAGTGLAVVSFAAMALGPVLSVHGQLALLALSAVGFDLGAQVTLISHQTIVYGTDAGARSRLNAVLFVGMFIGMAIGAGAGGLLYAQWGWMAVTGLATISAAAALGVRLWSNVR